MIFLIIPLVTSLLSGVGLAEQATPETQERFSSFWEGSSGEFGLKCSLKHIDVACAIIERDGLVLAALRSETMSLPLKWEFPGGKIDLSETPEECLIREIHEEMGIRIRVGESLPPSSHQYPTLTVTLYPFICSIESGEIVLHEHSDMSWLLPSELHILDWAEADLPVIESYLSKCVRSAVRKVK